MKKAQFMVLFGGLSLLALGAFQNCSPGFQAPNATNTAAQSSAAGAHQALYIGSNSATVATGQDLQFAAHLDQQAPGAVYAWGYDLNGAQTGCTSRLGTTPEAFIVKCTQGGTLTVSLRVVVGEKNIGPVSYNVDLGGNGAPTTGGSGTGTTTTPGGTIVFEIPNGTGTASWNSTANKIEAIVGDTITIKNMDTTNHQMHTGGAPCPHGGSIAPGAQMNCVVTAAVDATKTKVVYDHISNAQVYLVAYSPAAQYSMYCMSCHGAAGTQHKGATAAQIKSGIAGVAQMQTTALKGLSDKQIEAISRAMK